MAQRTPEDTTSFWLKKAACGGLLESGLHGLRDETGIARRRRKHPVADWERGREAALCGREAAVYSEESINLWRLARCPV